MYMTTGIATYYGLDGTGV